MTSKQPPRKSARPAKAGLRKRKPDGEAKRGGARRDVPGHKSSRSSKPASKRASKRTEKPDSDRFDLEKGERIAKVMARAGLCSRREAESWVIAGRVEVNGNKLETPAVTVTQSDQVVVDGNPLPMRERTRLWLYHKPKGLVTTNHDPEGRPTVFGRLPAELPRVLSVGRLDINTEGLLLLTNDGGLARVLELPATGWLRRYRVRAFGTATQAQLDTLRDGVAIDEVLYGAIEATLDKEQGKNVWLTVGLREGKNREVKKVLEHLGLTVNRLIRISFGPFQLMELDVGDVREIRGKVLRDQLGEKLAEEAGADFDAPIFHQAKPAADKPGQSRRKDAGGGKAERPATGSWLSEREAKAVKSGKKMSGPRTRSDDRAKQMRRDDSGRTPRGGRTAEHRADAARPTRKGMSGSNDRPFESERPARAPRRIWSEEGLLEDKQQEQRMGRKPQQHGRGGEDRAGGPRKPLKDRRS